MNGINRLGTYSCSFRSRRDPAEYSKILVTFSQGQQIIVEKTQGDTGLEINGNLIEITLTQEETSRFRPSAGSPMGRATAPTAFVQIRAYKGPLDAPAGKTWPLNVYDALDEEVLS